MSALHDLLELPESVVKSAFVVQLTEGVRHPEVMLKDYAITPDLQRAFDQSLALVKSTLVAVEPSKSDVDVIHP